MYKISEEQIDFIAADIRQRGIGIQSLHDNLLDHICCIIEDELEDGGDFEKFYATVIVRFYKTELVEIEKHALLETNYKNHYLMKKMMVLSGIFSVSTMLIGVWFKLMHFPGAAVLLPFGIALAVLFFFPLFLIIKSREQAGKQIKRSLIFGSLAILLLGSCFIIQLLGGPKFKNLSMQMFYASASVSLILYIPFYLSEKYKNPDTRLGAITTVLLIVMGYTLWFAALYNRRSDVTFKKTLTQDYIRNQQILKLERLKNQTNTPQTINTIAPFSSSEKIDAACEDAKRAIVEAITGQKTLDESFEAKELYLLEDGVPNTQNVKGLLRSITPLVIQYNNSIKDPVRRITLKYTFMEPADSDFSYLSAPAVLNQLTQVQLMLLQNENQLVASR